MSESTTSESKTYVGLHTCGGWLACIVNNPEHAKDTAKEVSSWVKSGLTVSLVETQSIRDGSTPMCECPRNRKVAKRKV